MSMPKWEIGPVKLADGGDAQIFLFDEFRKVYLGAYRLQGGGLYALEWMEDGRPIDAVAAYTLAPPPKKKVRVDAMWIVVFAKWNAHGFYNEQQAKYEAKQKRAFAIKKIEPFEVEEGEGL